MARSSMFPRSVSKVTPRSGMIDAAEMAEAARGIALSLPGLARQAEASGMQLVAQHLNKALQLAERIAAASPGR